MITVNDREDYLREVAKQLPGNSTAVEIGCYRGEFSIKILDIITPVILHLIDPFETDGLRYKEMDVTTAYSNMADFNEVSRKFRDMSVDIDINYSHNAVGNYKNNYFDFIYHDASHLYEDLKRDLSDWLPKLKVNGLMCGHDYIDHPDFGVIQAVDEFCTEHNFEMIIYNENGGDYALRRCTV